MCPASPSSRWWPLPLGCAVSALTGVFSLYFFGDLPAGMLLRGLWVWWLGDLLGVFLIAPLLLTAARWDLLPTNRGARLEGLVLVLGMLALTLGDDGITSSPCVLPKLFCS